MRISDWSSDVCSSDLGGYAPPPGVTTILGLEVAGEIVAVGEGVDRVHVGAHVCALVAGGGYAQYAVAPAGQCLPRPARLSWAEAAALPETVFTVWVNVFERAYAKRSEEHTSELQSLMRISYAVFCLKKNTKI